MNLEELCLASPCLPGRQPTLADTQLPREAVSWRFGTGTHWRESPKRFVDAVDVKGDLHRWPRSNTNAGHRHT